MSDKLGDWTKGEAAIDEIRGEEIILHRHR